MSRLTKPCTVVQVRHVMTQVLRGHQRSTAPALGYGHGGLRDRETITRWGLDAVCIKLAQC